MIAVINTYPYLLFRPEGKINEGKRTTEKAKGTLNFHYLGPHRIYYTNSVNDRLDRIYGGFYRLNKTELVRRADSKVQPYQQIKFQRKIYKSIAQIIRALFKPR